MGEAGAREVREVRELGDSHLSSTLSCAVLCLHGHSGSFSKLLPHGNRPQWQRWTSILCRLEELETSPVAPNPMPSCDANVDMFIVEDKITNEREDFLCELSSSAINDDNLTKQWEMQALV